MKTNISKHFYLICIFILLLLPKSILKAQNNVEDWDRHITNLNKGLSISSKDFYNKFTNSAAGERVTIDDNKSGFGTFDNGINAMIFQTNAGRIVAFLEKNDKVNHIRLTGNPPGLGSSYVGSSLSLLVATMNAVCDPSKKETNSIYSMQGLENLIKDNTFRFGKCVIYHGVDKSGRMYGAMITHKDAKIPWK